MATASPFEAALRDVVERLYAATTQLSGGDDEGDVARRSVALALNLTRSTEAAIGLGGLSTGHNRFYSHSADTESALPDDAVAALLQSSGLLPVAAGARRGASAGRRLAAIGVELTAGSQAIGVLVVGRPSEYDDTEKQLLSIFAAQVGRVFEAAEFAQRQHDFAVQVLTAVSSHATAGQSLTDFYRRLARTVAELVGADKVLFWRLKDTMLAPIPGSYGLSEAFLARLTPTSCEPDGNDLASRIVFRDGIFRANRSDDSLEFAYVLERLGVASAISVPWRAGKERLGLLAAYDATRPGGFSREDTWVLQKAGLAAGLVTQLWHTQEDLRKSVERHSKVDAARQLLLKNMTTVVEKERRRFVNELHDDALQKLTAAEMQVARLTPGGTVDSAIHEALTSLLADTEAALRKLVFEVHPPALDAPDGLIRSITDRAAILSASGIKAYLELNVPEDLSYETKALIFRQIAEALGNVERHSHATEVKVSLNVSDDGVFAVITDNGRGFVVAERSNLPGHLGLQALKERALMAGGSYKVESQPGAGTHIEFWIPIEY